MLKNPASMKRDTSSAKFMAISREVPPCFVTRSLLVTDRELQWMNQE
jgi:hypothetical protein